MSEAEQAQFEKEVVQLPDGRRLIYYRFPAPPPAAPAAPGPGPSPATGKER
jgi:hypothetical protein